MEIHERIVFLRKRKKISQKELAKLISVDDSTMSKIETGSRPLRHFELEKIADILSISTDELLGRKQSAQADVLILRFEQGLTEKTKNKILHFIEEGSES
ncbi:helix-turn-helix domain-containing protein [Listeria valentina]|uniref:helix-turn-helix domain-containing protein n=1 Tax=Listeria valentina TaxID=2705293 RepID=UPI0014308722|nr:helix-turn-helix transcriptional regulator [Listeria valentina]